MLPVALTRLQIHVIVRLKEYGANWSGPSPTFDYTTNGGKTWAPLA